MTDAGLPKGWEQTTLGKIAFWSSGGTPKSGNKDFYGGDIPWAVIGDLNDGLLVETAGTITQDGLDNSSAKWVSAGSVLVAMYGASIGKLGLTGAPLTTNQAIAAARPSDKVTVKFLFYYLMSQREKLVRAGKGAAQPNIGQGTLKAWPVIVPSLLEQERIVNLLEDYLSRLEAGADYLDAARRRLNRLTTARLKQATHDLPDSVTVALKEIADVRLGRQRSPKNHTGDRMRPYLRAANVDWNTLRLADVKTMNFTAEEEEVYRLEDGDILLTEASGSAAEVGKSVLYRGEPSGVCFQNTLLRVRCHGADPTFVQKYLLADARAGRFMPEARGVGINHLGKAGLAKLQIELPRTVEAQAEAAAESVEILENSARLARAIEFQVKRAASLRRSLLAAAFSGRLTGAASDVERVEEIAADIVEAEAPEGVLT